MKEYKFKYPRLSKLISKSIRNHCPMEIDSKLRHISYLAKHDKKPICHFDEPVNLIRIAKICFYKRHQINNILGGSHGRN